MEILNVISVVHPKKYGLLDICEALSFYGNQSDSARAYSTITSRAKLAKLLVQRKSKKGSIGIVFWDNSFFSLFCLCLGKLFGARTFYYLHEPGGIGQKLIKGDRFIYAICASLAEALMGRLASKVIVPRFEALVFGDCYAPLLFVGDESEYNSSEKKFIGFLGSRRKSRLEHVYRGLQAKLNKLGVESGYFPSKEFGVSKEDKLAFLNRCDAVWNVYAVPYNQSGVTGDCIMSDIRCIVSHYEPFLEELRQLNLALEVDITTDEDLIIEKLMSIYKEDSKKIDESDRRKIRSKFGGTLAFSKYWKPLFNHSEK